MFRFAAKLIISVVVIGAAAMYFFGHTPGFPVSSVVTQKASLFTVSGDGKVTVVPDIAIVTLGVNATGPTVKNTQTQANQIINSITAKIKSLGVADKDIVTNNYSLYPQYNYQTPTNRITGYSVSVNLTVTVRQLDRVNDVIDSATSLGANTVGGIQFTVNDDRKKQLTQQARDLAVADAKAKAQSLAQAAGLNLGRLVNVEETSTPEIRPLPMMGLGAAVNASAGGGTQVQPGSTDITSSLTLSYETR